MKNSETPDKKPISKQRYTVQAALIGSAYVALTLILAPLSYGPIQIRFSDSLAILPYFTPAAIPGLFIGCLISNLNSPYGILDMVCGSLATLLAAFGTYFFRKTKILAPLPPVVFNALIIGALLYYGFGVNASFLVNVLWVGGGEAIACYAVGFPLLLLLEKRRSIFDL